MELAFDDAMRGSGMTEEIGVGLLGYAFMGRAHTNAYRTLRVRALDQRLARARHRSAD
jgi:hypothetical protein